MGRSEATFFHSSLSYLLRLGRLWVVGLDPPAEARNRRKATLKIRKNATWLSTHNPKFVFERTFSIAILLTFINCIVRALRNTPFILSN